MTTTSKASTKTTTAEWFGTAARYVSPLPLIMGFFMLVYAFWFIPAWGLLGGIIFGALAVYAVICGALAIRNIKHAVRHPSIKTPEGEAQGKKMAVLSGITYPLLWLSVIALPLLGQAQFIMQAVVIIIGLHFIPMAKIQGRRIDYVLGPISVLFGIVGVLIALNNSSDWQLAFAVAGVGGAGATFVYAFYNLIGYRKMSEQAHALPL
ncbi:hypothetical protein [Microbacterium amylolyticum]|uniref:Uncharacterized protein n=1 Tax=Microbacterium amylolyticum TaxID=936337 RepID=A0ABS4ZFS0_9MICO|nr:hypothetical protein [Microbacterium amylolyticum]MBP2436067.1 hypothetical protein [Microbacterium amylolyticum]